ncbi:MAG TPA: hypothetical protein C5S51_04935, partial [Methanosarcinaceae archaeon]|nr:hypothetical protein [Methanosarcinaceae archaeon]
MWVEIMRNYKIILGKIFLFLIPMSIFLFILLFTANIASAETSPDIVVQDITWSPTNPSLGDTVTFTTTIKNQGNGTSNAGQIYFYLDGLVSPLTHKSFTTINADSTTTVSFTWVAQAGLHSFKAVADKENSIPESDETNNENTVEFSSTSLSDLLVQNITWSPTNPSIGEVVTFTSTIKNQGSGSSSNSRVYFY